MRSAATSFTSLTFTTALLAACGPTGQPAPEACLAPSSIDASDPVTRLGVHMRMGDAPLTLGGDVTFPGGPKLRATKARFFVSAVGLLDEAGNPVAAELVDDRGERLPYGVAMIDLERPDGMSVNLKAPAGRYRAVTLSVGVPATCPSGEQLNHSDASAMKAPLDVDNDMYWTWSAGYTFLKFEGQVEDGDGWDGFFFHVGDDRRLAELELRGEFTITPEGGNGPELIADFARLLTSAAGARSPDIGDDGQRHVHGGEGADLLADNLRTSGFLTLGSAHQ